MSVLQASLLVNVRQTARAVRHGSNTLAFSGIHLFGISLSSVTASKLCT